MEHKEKKIARRYDTPLRDTEYTNIVYSSGKYGRETVQMMRNAENKYSPEPPDYKIFIGEMHGHTNLSDGKPDIDTYFKTARDTAKLDFTAISDHDHGGVFSTELWGEKWELIKSKVKEYYEPGKFTTILAYERDSYPWYNNLVLYYNSHDGEIVRSSVDGEITAEELYNLLQREDIITVPHSTSFLDSGTDFTSIPDELMTPFIEVYSRWGADEYFDNPYPVRIGTRGGYWHDALRKGAKMGCISGSDDHQGYPGLIMEKANHVNLKYRYPGLTGILAKENTLQSIYEALKAKRCYGFMGGRIYIDFRINGHYMGEKFTTEDTRSIWFEITADAPIKRINLVKNLEDYMYFDCYNDSVKYSKLIFDYKKEQDTAIYYLRIELTDGRFAWTSPIWIK